MRLGYFYKFPVHSLAVSVLATHIYCWTQFRNNECPACRTHCASRRSLRDDPNYDALIAALYPDIDKYEKEVEVEKLITSSSQRIAQFDSLRTF